MRRRYLALMALVVLFVPGCNTVKGACADIYGAASGMHNTNTTEPPEVQEYMSRR